MRARPKSRSLAIYLFKKDTTRADLRSSFRKLDNYAVIREGTRLGELFVKPPAEKPPNWLSLFKGFTSPPLEKILNRSVSAVFLAEVQKRLVALTFGYGWSFLPEGSYEEDFGLKVTLNSIDPGRVKSIDRVSFDAASRYSRIQASQETTIGAFGLDVEQDLLRAVTGTPVDAKLGTRLTGKDALHAQANVALADLHDLIGRYLDQYRKKTYKEHYPWIDQIHEVQDPEKLSELEEKLITKILAGDFSNLWLTAPEIIDWDRVAGFRYRPSPNREAVDDIHISSFLSSVSSKSELTADQLKHKYTVHAIDNAVDAPLKKWSLYRCLYFETESGKSTFLLNNGKWYRISKDFLDRVNQAFADVPKNVVALPNFVDANEGAYNTRVAGEANIYALMDRNLIVFEGAADPIEFCDLFSNSKEIIHVKRYAGSSALSHLFAQGLVSGTLFSHEAIFRRQVRRKLPRFGASIPITRKPNRKEFAVIFAVISKSQGPLGLPFFSRITLRNAFQTLTDLGYKVSMSKIQA